MEGVPMDPTVQPKRRGRKKKTEPAPVPEKVVAPKVEQPQIIQAKNIAKTPENLQKERERIVCELEERAKDMDRAIEDVELMERVYKKMRRRLYLHEYEAEEERDRIRAGGTDSVEWQGIVQPGLMRRVSSVVEFLVRNGPMTRIENEIFGGCIDAIREYYGQRVECVAEEGISSGKREMYLRTTFYPRVNTPAYRIFSEVVREMKREKGGIIFDYFRSGGSASEQKSAETAQ